MNDPKPYEQSMLGALLLTANAGPHVRQLIAEGLSFSHFYYGRHREIFIAMTALTDRDEPVDVLTVQAEVQRRGVADAFKVVGGVGPFVHSLPNSVPNVGALKDYAKRVMEMSAVRRMRVYALALAKAAEREDYQGIADAQKALTAIELPGARANGRRRLEAVQ